MQPARRLPDDFLVGCATAAHQVEGWLDNDWTRMEHEHPQRIKDGSVSGIACDHHARYRADLEMLAAMGHSAYRFSIEWSRVEPREGVFDATEVAHYRDVVHACRELGLEPVVTLQHFTLPTWLAERGGILDADTPRLFARFAALCAESFGHEVRWWITVNEPAVLAVFGYLYGEWPPLQRSNRLFFSALRGLARMHAAAYRAVHRVASERGWDARVSFAHHERPLHALNPGSVLDRAAAVAPNYLFNRWFLRACRSGLLLPPVGRGQRVPGLRGSLDYLALNFYCEERVRFNVRQPSGLFAEHVASPNLPLSSFGWSIEPDALRRALVRLWEDIALPILIAENGVADTADELRPRFIVDHLGAVCDALNAGVDVRGYLHWSSMDNFEWAEGYSQRFGIIAVDRATMVRTPKPSAAVLSDICATRLVPVS
jgi:beta-glucosidase